MRIKWLHLSDIHFNYKNYNSHDLRADFILRIKALQEGEPFTHLFITGDLLYRNQEADNETVEFLVKLIETMNLPLERVFIVPGNHDHDRIATKEIISKNFNDKEISECPELIDSLPFDSVSMLLNNFEHYNNVYKKLFKHDYYDTLKNPHIIISQDDLSIIKLNTAWIDIDSTDNHDFLQIGSRQLQMILSENKETLNKTNNIAIGHHCFRDMTPTERNRIMDQFKRHNIGIYFCGHRHKPEINNYMEQDIIEIVAPGGYNDGYSNGGYVSGIIDTTSDFYKAEVYSWYNGKWCIESKLEGTDSHGMYCFRSKKFQHNSNIAVVDCKTMNGHIARVEIEKTLNCNNFDLYTYPGLLSNPRAFDSESVSELKENIERLVENNKSVHLFPMAPIPMLILLGFELQKNSNINIHQYDRKNRIWVSDGLQNDISILPYNEIVPKEDILAFSISTSFQVSPLQISNALKGHSYDLLEIKTNKIELGSPLYIKDVECVAEQIISCLSNYVQSYKEIHIFAAIPAGLAIEIGRNMLSSIYSNIYTYQLKQNNYERTLIINPRTDNVEPNNISNILYMGNLNINLKYLPVLGEIACGELKDSLKDNTEYYPILNTIIPSGEYFVLKAKGDSMIDVGIEDGDYVIVKVQQTADSGQIVVALVENETTLKRLFIDRKRKKIILHPENNNYTDIILDKMDIQGVAIQVIKNL